MYQPFLRRYRYYAPFRGARQSWRGPHPSLGVQPLPMRLILPLWTARRACSP